MLERVTVTRYATPLREGGSLPGLVEADNLGTYEARLLALDPGTDLAAVRAAWPRSSALAPRARWPSARWGSGSAG